MNTVEPHIKKYIDASIDAVEMRWDKKMEKKIDETVAKARHEFGLEIKGYMKDLRDGFQQDVKMGFEAADLHMRVIARETTREVIREEVPGIVRKELMMFLVPAH